MKGLADNLKKRRVMLGLTQKDMELQGNIPPGTMSNLEKGYRVPTLKNLKKISTVLGVTIDSLLTEN